MITRDSLTAAPGAAELVIDESGDADLTSAVNLIDSAPDYPATPEFFERVFKLRSYRGPVRNTISDADYDALRAALRALAPHFDEYSDEEVGYVGDSLLSLNDSRPAEQLFYDFCSVAGYPLGVEWWLTHARDKPTTDFRSAFQLVHTFGEFWSALSDPPGTPASKFMPKVPDLSAPRPKWLVKGVVPEKALVVVYGKWGTGKSTLAIELCAAIAQGKSWHGRKVQQGTAVYIASENEHGFRARLDALLRDQGITLDTLGGRLLEITGRPHLLRPNEVTELVAELKPLSPLSVIVVDTLARATAGGDENAVKETMIAIENCQTIMNETGATVVLIHHVGKDESRGARGSSALPAAADTEIVLERPDETTNLRTASLGKQRDAPDYVDLFNYELKVVELGVDEDGDKITSTVVREVDPPPPETVVELPNTPVRRAIRGVLGNAQRAMEFEELIGLVKSRLAPPDPGDKDRRRARIKQTAERMVGDRELHVDASGMVSLLNPAIPFAPVPTHDLVGSES